MTRMPTFFIELQKSQTDISLLYSLSLSSLPSLCFKILYQDKLCAGFYAENKRWDGNEAIKPEHNSLEHMIYSCPKDGFPLLGNGEIRKN